MRSASGSRFHLSGGPVTPFPLGPLTATPFPTAVPPFVEIEVVDTVTSFSTITIERLDPDGIWRPVRGAEPAPLTGGTWAGEDFECPYGVVVTYRATREDGTQFGSLTGTPSGPSSSFIFDVQDVWLVHAGIPMLSQKLLVQSFADEVQVARRGLFQPLAGFHQIAVSQQRLAASSSLTVLLFRDSDRRGLVDLLADGSPLLLNVPISKGFDLPSVWVSVGDVGYGRVSRVGSEHLRTAALPYVEVDRPVGDLQSIWSYAALVATEDSYASVHFDYASYADLAAHRPIGS